MKRAGVIPYEDYKTIQIHRSGKKWGATTFWNNIMCFKDTVQDALRITGTYPSSICCMGIRNGNEYTGFKETVGFKNVKIYGVDIHPDVVKVGDNCFCFDFAKLPRNWKKKFDWVYSNSLDHSYDLKKTLREWHRVCKGYILLTMSTGTKTDQSDVYSFDIKDADVIFDKKLFEVLKVWKLLRVDTIFNVLLKVL